MSAISETIPQPQTGEAKPIAPQFLPVAKWRCVLAVPWKFFVALVFAEWLPLPLLIVGWTQCLMQRVVLKSWWKQSAQSDTGATFEFFLSSDPRLLVHRHWPNWLLDQNATLRQQRGIFRLLLGSLWQNAKLGVQAIFNVWVFTLPGALLMWFGWYDGWNNSFTKGYEQFWVGPAVSWAGIALFVAAMFYVPMAHARQAATGNWRAFYDFKTVRAVIKRRWYACLGLAALYAVLTAPVMAMMAAPQFFQNIPKLADFTPQQAQQFLATYFFWCGLYVAAAYVFLRIVAAKIYAASLLRCVQTGTLDRSALGEIETLALENLELLRSETPAPRHPVVRVVTWTGGRAMRFTAGFATGLLFFAMLVETHYIPQFLNHRAGIGWLNDALVQLPWIAQFP